jgi:hypothetical protein
VKILQRIPVKFSGRPARGNRYSEERPESLPTLQLGFDMRERHGDQVEPPHRDDELRNRHCYQSAGQCSVVAVLPLEVTTFKAAIATV